MKTSTERTKSLNNSISQQNVINLLTTRSSKDECSTESNNHLRDGFPKKAAVMDFFPRGGEGPAQIFEHLFIYAFLVNEQEMINSSSYCSFSALISEETLSKYISGTFDPYRSLLRTVVQFEFSQALLENRGLTVHIKLGNNVTAMAFYSNRQCRQSLHHNSSCQSHA